ncbi:hypothetical protein [Polaromonas sp. CG9_12]|nr:hypothetical protein [Polaromonas sp. CG9_12]
MAGTRRLEKPAHGRAYIASSARLQCVNMPKRRGHQCFFIHSMACPQLLRKHRI